MRHRLVFFGCLIVGALALIACNESEAQSGASSALVSRLNPVLTQYEAMRAALAEDRMEDVSGIAERLDTAASTAAEGASASVGQRLTEMRAATTSIREGGAPDTVRRHFGDLSRAVVSLLVEERALTEGRYIFTCPMAQGYAKWVQTAEQLENPYMGQRMLRCGTSSEWRI